jgi:HemY protein
VTGRLDAFQWQRPLAALPSDKNAAIEAKEFNEAITAPRRVEPPRDAPIDLAPAVAQDNSPVLDAAAPAPVAAPEPSPPPQPETPPVATAPPPPTETPPVTAAPLFRARGDIPSGPARSPSSILPVIPIVRAPDDPGIDDEPGRDEFAEQIGPAPGQAGGWRGFLSRWGAD